ncbi:hypothetical protein C7446_2514 [Kushneria sinocarnis]|uniref:Uncharacterized protein n=1 Tax=Kushneria sinocarnis TaxID=595502 RepID=A0A420WUH6_9GAMM|nr:hypothetical protein [Kushneria sinocarnis]RKQ97095.1 hypothetical protein C7446_2514 [Kushneria sinocarnis]
MTIDSDLQSIKDIGFTHTIDRIERHFKAEAARELAMKRPPDSVQRAWLLEEAQKYREG